MRDEGRPLARYDGDDDSMGAKPNGFRARRNTCPSWVTESMWHQ